MFVRNISAEIQKGVETYLPGLGEIDVAPGEVFQCRDDQGLFLAQSYEKYFEIILNITGGSGEVNTGNNIGAGAGVFGSKLGTTLNFKSLVGGSNVSINESATEIEIIANIPASTQIQVDFSDNSTEYIVLGQISLYRAFIVEYTLEGGGNNEVGYMYIIHDGTNIDINHEYAGIPAIIDDMNYSVNINSGNARIGLQSINVGSGLKFKYTVKFIDIST